MKNVVFGSILILMALLSSVVYSQEPPRISKEKLRTMLGKPNVFILDVRIDVEWRASGKKIQGAIRENPEQVELWLDKYPKDKTLVFYCS